MPLIALSVAILLVYLVQRIGAPSPEEDYRECRGLDQVED